MVTEELQMIHDQLRSFGFPVDQDAELTAILIQHWSDILFMKETAGHQYVSLFRYGLPALATIIKNGMVSWKELKDGVIAMTKIAGMGAEVVYQQCFPLLQQFLGMGISWKRIVEDLPVVYWTFDETNAEKLLSEGMLSWDGLVNGLKRLSTTQERASVIIIFKATEDLIDTTTWPRIVKLIERAKESRLVISFLIGFLDSSTIRALQPEARRYLLGQLLVYVISSWWHFRSRLTGSIAPFLAFVKAELIKGKSPFEITAKDFFQYIPAFEEGDTSKNQPSPNVSVREGDTGKNQPSPNVSVREILPGMNLNGLVLKGQKRDDTSEESQIDYDKEVYSTGKRDGRIIPGMDYTSDAGFAIGVYKSLNERKIYAENNPELNEALSLFVGKVVVDLGAGSYPIGYCIVDYWNARGYIGVEPNYIEDLVSRLQHVEEFAAHKLNRIPFAVVAEDMLGFLRRLPDNSVSIFCSGIDLAIIPRGNYRDEVAKEIMRVLDPNGVYIGHSSGGHIYIKDALIEEKHINNEGISGSVVAYRKKTPAQEERP